MIEQRGFNLKISTKQIVKFIVIIVIFSLLSFYKLPYYIYTPGKALDLKQVVQVSDGNESKGSLHLLTVSGQTATPLLYAIAQFKPYDDIVPIAEARPHGISDEEYLKSQLNLMENSQEASTVVAYEAANADIDITYNGVYVLGVIKDMPADDILQVGDLITKIDNKDVFEAEDLTAYIQEKKNLKAVDITFKRNDKVYNKKIKLTQFPDEDKKGIGIQLVTNRDVNVDPDVEFSSGNIGGPSAGMMLALSIYDQLEEEDLTKGLKIAGSGQLDYDGNVLPIGGIDKKVIAADKKDIDILFAPSMETHEQSNYEEAKEMAEEIDSDMKIIPVETFQDALDYLKTVAE